MEATPARSVDVTLVSDDVGPLSQDSVIPIVTSVPNLSHSAHSWAPQWRGHRRGQHRRSQEGEHTAQPRSSGVCLSPGREGKVQYTVAHFWIWHIIIVQFSAL